MKKALSILLVFFLHQSIRAQSCGSCSININALDSASYTVTAGQTLCVSNGGQYIGQITLNGGVICVQGNFSPKSIVFTSGTINNNGTSTFPGSITLGSSSIINNQSGGILNVNGSLTLNSGSLTNASIFNVTQEISNSGTITNSSIINCVIYSGAGSLSNNGVINSN